jgi:tetratricopeptide (TPR) repeat protein
MNRDFALTCCLCIFALLFPSRASSQRSGADTVTLSGIVYVELGDQPILNASVRLCDDGGRTLSEVTTSDSGEFAFRGIPRGKYILQISADGFVAIRVDMDLTFNSDRGVPVYLKPVALKTNETAAGGSVSVHELSMPQGARESFASGKKKMYIDKNLQGALSDFQAAVAGAPGYYEAYYQMALANISLGSKADAEANLRKSIETSGDKYGDADVGLGSLLLDRGQPAEAERFLRRGIELEPNLWLGHQELGRALFNQQKDSEALKSAELARALSPNSPVIYRLLANIHLRAKDYRALLADIDAYVKLDPDSAAGIRAKQMRGQVAQKVAGP